MGADTFEPALNVAQSQFIVGRLQVIGVGVVERVQHTLDGALFQRFRVQPVAVDVFGEDDIPCLPHDVQGGYP